MARIRGIGLFEDKEQIIPGWQGQPKGLLQALWGRGMIGKQMLDKYTLDGCKHPITGIVDLQYSLRHLLSDKELVKECTSPTKVVTKVRVEKFAARTCIYMHLPSLGTGARLHLPLLPK